MAGKAKTDYLTVTKRGSPTSVFKRTFFRKSDLNKYIATEEFKEKYPESEYKFYIECY